MIEDSLDQELSPGDYSWSFTTITPIATARAVGDGWIGTIQGNVTVIPDLFSQSRHSFVIQDDTGGIYVYPAYGYVLPIDITWGDVVRVTGTIDVYHGLQEFVDITAMSEVSTGTVPSAEVTNTNAVAPVQGKLIQVEGTITFTETPTVPGTDLTFSVTDGTGPVAVYRYRATSIDLSSYTSGQKMRIIGVSGAYDVPQVQPRIPEDIVDLPPEVSNTNPIDTATGVNPYLPVSASFDQIMDSDTIDETSFTLTGGTSGAISGIVSYDEDTHTAIFTPDSPLQPGESYTAALTTDVACIHGLSLAEEESWTFTTGDYPPTVSSVSPLDAATSVPLDSDIAVTFSEAVGVTDGWYIITCSISGTHTAIVDTSDYITFTLTPDAIFKFGESCTVTLDHTKITDQDTDDPLDEMVENYEWGFDIALPSGIYYVPLIMKAP